MLRFLLGIAVLQAAFGQESPRYCRERYREEIEARPKSSLVHFQLAECYSRVKDRAAAVSEFREALNGDLKPGWVRVWSHINLGKIFDATGQRERALNQYRLAEQTQDHTCDAQEVAAKYRQAPLQRTVNGRGQRAIR